MKVNAAQEAPSLAPLSPHKEAIVSADSRDLPTPAEVSAVRSSRTASAKPISQDTFPPTGDSIELNRENGIAALSKGRSAAVVVDRSGRDPAETHAQAEVAARSDSEKATAYSLAKKTADREQQPETAPRYAMPAGGWEQWREYISKNKKVPPANSAVTGNQVLSFTVHRNGTISDIRMIHSLSPWHDAEAMRLLRQGPPWKVLKGKQQVVSITIGFSNL